MPIEGARPRSKWTWILVVAFLGASLFPYTQLIPNDSYTQPYAVLLGSLLFATRGAGILRSIPRPDAVALLGLAGVGVAAFAISCLPDPNGQELKYLLVYVSPLVMTVAAVVAFSEYPVTARRVLAIAAVIWLAIGAIQTVYDPGFATAYVGEWQEAAGIVVDSGRGVLGLAPEPTHYGFHLVIVAAVLILIGGSRAVAWSCIAGALLLARSSSAALALLLGACVYVVRTPFRYKGVVLMALAVVPVIAVGVLAGFDQDGSRLLFLAGAFLENPTAILQVDPSVNIRLGGLIVTLRESLDAFLLPHGLSHAAWLQHQTDILSRYDWLFDLNEAGPPSGFGVVAYQLGIVGVALLIRPISRMTARIRDAGVEQLIVVGAVWVFLWAYFISAPGYALLYGAAICAAPTTESGHVPSMDGRPARAYIASNVDDSAASASAT